MADYGSKDMVHCPVYFNNRGIRTVALPPTPISPRKISRQGWTEPAAVELAPALEPAAAAVDSTRADLASNPATALSACRIPPSTPRTAASPPPSCLRPASWGAIPDGWDRALSAVACWCRTC